MLVDSNYDNDVFALRPYVHTRTDFYLVNYYVTKLSARDLCLSPRPTTQESAVVLYYCYHRSLVAYQLTTTTMIDDIVLNMTS